MLIHPMAERLRDLGLTAMADAFLDMRNQSAVDDLSREDWLGLLIDREVATRENKRLGRRLNLARLRPRWSRTPICARHAVSPAAYFQTLTTCGWIRDGHHVLIGGPTDPAS
jgi:IstB-like ATP binding protein